MHGKFLYVGDRVISYNHIAPGEDWQKLKASGCFGRGVCGVIAQSPPPLSCWCVKTDYGSYSGVFAPMVRRLYHVNA